MDRTMMGYKSVPAQEKKKSQGYEKIKEYEYFYLYGKYKDGKLLYKETFSKFDIDGVPKQEKKRGPMCGKTHRGKF